MIFANAIENAINACSKMPEGAERFLTITCSSKSQLVIEIANSYAGEIELSGDDIPINREQGHSIGTQSILSIVNKYDAVCDYKITDTVFRLRVLLWMTS